MLHKIIDRWNKYWFGRQAIYSVEFGRFALVLAYFYTLIYHPFSGGESFLKYHDAALWSPKSFLALFFSEPPSAGTINFVRKIALITPWLLLVGFKSRWASLLLFFSHLFLRALYESYFVVWSHGYNVIFLAHLPFLFAPVGQLWSVDALIRKIRKKEPIQLVNGYWPVLLAQWGTATMFFCAFYWKVLDKTNVFALKWATTDSMRNHILDRYLGVGDEIPENLLWIVENSWAYHGMAVGNLMFQLLPFLAAFFTRKPLVRFLFGMAFVVEELGLGIVMGLPDYHWLFLISFFIDWDHLFKWLSTKRESFATQLHSVDLKRIPFQAISNTFIILFLTAWAFFGTELSKELTGKTVFQYNAYPFSKFSMYSQIKEGKDGVPFCRFRNAFDVVGGFSEEKKNKIDKYLTRRSYNKDRYDDPEIVLGIIQTHKKVIESRWKEDANKIDVIRTKKVLFDYPPWPEPPELQVKYAGVRGELFADGTFRTCQFFDSIPATSKSHVLIQLNLVGWENPEVQLFTIPKYYEGPKVDPIPVEALYHSGWNEVPIEKGRYLMLAEVNEAGSDESVIYISNGFSR